MERSINGLEPSVVTCFPTIKFNQHIFTSSEDNLCTICLSDYKVKEVLRILPRCGHAFHIACIDLWLRQHHTCPVCRISLQVFSEWTHMAGPLISTVAKARFVPGALPDHLFEQPKNCIGVPHSMPSGAPKNSLAWTVIAKTLEFPEAGESSSLSLQESQLLPRSELQPGDRQQLLEHRVSMESDALFNHDGSVALSPQMQGINHDESLSNAIKNHIHGGEGGVSLMSAVTEGAQSGASAANQSLPISCEP